MKLTMLYDVQIVIEEFQEDIELSLIGFPEDYMTLLNNSIRWKIFTFNKIKARMKFL